MNTNNTVRLEQVKGLSSEEVIRSRQRHGRNEILATKNKFITRLVSFFKEPMIVLLLVAGGLYFITGATQDGIFMVAAIFLVTGISLYQESRSRNAMEALRSLTQPENKVIRDGTSVKIKREEIVVGDCIVVEEGTSIPADGIVLHSNDFSVNESILTGEALPVNKGAQENEMIFQGTMVVSGLAVCQVTAIGSHTRLGNIGKSIEDIKEEKSPLQIQIQDFVKKMALIGFVVFLLVWLLNYFKSENILTSLLQALTLAMSILPEEIPVAFTTFMAVGAWRLMKLGVIIKNTATVETLGSASIICVDKTGTITENKMSLAKIYSFELSNSATPSDPHDSYKEVIRYAMWASEPIPFDPMEKALHEAYCKSAEQDERKSYQLVHEYPLEGKPPMMTHVFSNERNHRIIAAKGAPEAILKVTGLSPQQRENVNIALEQFTSLGFRVLGVAVSEFKGNDFPKTQQQLSFGFKGLVAFYDPPKQHMSETLNSFYQAGIQVKIITGDNTATTKTIAHQINFRGDEQTLEGEELIQMEDNALKKKVNEVNLFTRMFPEAKLRIIKALKSNGDIVAMTGDGVNDGPALKAAHISIAMGKKGSALAKEVASLVLTDDDLSKMVLAVGMGRKIYANLKKAIQYIISIHIPIILTVLVPLILGWTYPSLLTPLHVIFLELIMGPTCSIVYENEPMEKNTMLQKPRAVTTSFFSWKELRLSIIQGLVISGAALGVYQFGIHHQCSEELTRTLVFLTLVTANIFLTLSNRSFYYSIFTMLQYRNNMMGYVIGFTVILTGGMILLPPFAHFFKFETPSLEMFLVSVGAGLFSVIWLEVFKIIQRRKKDSTKLSAI